MLSFGSRGRPSSEVGLMIGFGRALVIRYSADTLNYDRMELLQRSPMMSCGGNIPPLQSCDFENTKKIHRP